MRVGGDTGGTFTDIVGDDGRVAKVLSTPDDPSRALRAGIDGVSGARPELLAHGTTVATNALLERRGGTVALVTTSGFADVIEIARQDRPSLYDPWVDRPEPLVDRHRRFEVAGRLDAAGREIEPVADDVPEISADVDAVAVCLLHADLNADHEIAVAARLRSAGHDVTCSSDVAAEFREYERTVTTVVNAYLRPRTREYLGRLDDLAHEVLVLSSAGGLLTTAEAAAVPASLLLSGPAGGVAAAAAASASAGFPNAITFDMGGTSTDVCLVLDGAPAPAAQRTAAGFPIRLAALDIHTIGAGGGSIAAIDAGGALRVGPASAGADPGPACYGRGGTEATVTDADLVLGRIPVDAAFPGLGVLDRTAAAAALDRTGADAEGVVAVVDAAMERALRRVSVERGVDPAGLALIAFGGAGPLHACALAESLGLDAVVVPQRAGVLSAVGLVASSRQRDLVHSWPTPADHHGVDDALAALAGEARAAVGGTSGVDVTTSLDCRYAGQSHEITVATLADFAAEHRRRNGYERAGAAIEVVALRARARAASPLTFGDLAPATERSPARGPCVLAEPDCTAWVPEGWRAGVADDGSWVVRRT